MATLVTVWRAFKRDRPPAMAATPSSLFTLDTVRRAFERAWPKYTEQIQFFFRDGNFYRELSSATDALWIGNPKKNSLESYVLLSGDFLVNLPVLVDAFIIDTSQITVRPPPPFALDEVLRGSHDEYVNVVPVPAPLLKSPRVKWELPKLLNKRDTAARRAAKLEESKGLLEKAKEAVRKENGKIFIALDVKTYWTDVDWFFEVGWCLYDPNRPHDSILWPMHFIIEENINKGFNVENDKFLWESEVKPMAAVAACLRADLSMPGAVLVGHGLDDHLSFLRKSCGVGPSDLPQEQYDTGDLDLARGGDADAEITSLSEICSKFGVTTPGVNNAGNAAYYTIAAFLLLTML
ncbi:hypothetical protein HK104_010333 [Borealophlyctis nickersoniae]|nr:hypothetical protein HK104_010333 [Borealophlyctis nickersoniae]